MTRVRFLFFFPPQPLCEPASENTGRPANKAILKCLSTAYGPELTHSFINGKEMKATLTTLFEISR